jgi:hypothetical protein
MLVRIEHRSRKLSWRGLFERLVLISLDRKLMLVRNLIKDNRLLLQLQLIRLAPSNVSRLAIYFFRS